MAYLAVALVAVGVGLVLAVLWRQLERAEARAQTYADQLVKAVSSRPKLPEPVVVPAPDLTPYLDRLSAMAVDMAREVATGVALIVQGPPASGTAAVTAGGPDEPQQPEEERAEVWYPPWETDESWGVSDNMRETDEWSAHTGPDAHLHQGTGTHVADGNGVRRADGQLMFGSASMSPDEA